MNNVTNKSNRNVICVDGKLAGLKRHSEELNAVIIESLKGSLIALMEHKPYDSITVTELCKKAGVSRTAFYGNFTAKDELLERIVREINEQLVYKAGSPFGADTDLSWYVTLFELVKERAEIMRLIFGSGFRHKYTLLLNDIVLRHAGSSAENIYKRIIWSGGIENAIACWLDGGMRESIEEMACYCHSCLNV